MRQGLQTVNRARRRLIQYPRHAIRRSLLKMFFRFVGKLFARVEVTGAENLPKSGPLLLVGNHSAVIEAALMIAYVPYNVEVMAAADIPLDPRYGWVGDLYGVLPIKRGTMDRDGLNVALDILEQGGVVGLFPEGGIWEATLRDARTGVAWLSQKANAPIIPIGFGGLRGAVTSILRLRRPRLVMRIGKLIPPVGAEGTESAILTNGAGSRKRMLHDSANNIMQRVKELIPEEELRVMQPTYTNERFDFAVDLKTASGDDILIPSEVDIQEKMMLSKVFHRPVMLDVFARNLGLWVEPLLDVTDYHRAVAIANATRNVLDYIATNPYFFHYRFGNEQGEAMTDGYKQLNALARWAETHYPGSMMKITPIRHYTLLSNGHAVTETVPAPLPEI